MRRYHSQHTSDRRLPPPACALSTLRVFRMQAQTIVMLVLLAISGALSAPLSCTTQEAEAQRDLFLKANEKVVWSACGSKEWLVRYYEMSDKETQILFDIGCNKGYESTLLFQLFKPAAQVEPQNAYKVHKEQGRGLNGSLCGACDNCNERLQATRNASLPDPSVHVYCFEPSLTNFGNLLNVRNMYEEQLASKGAYWHLINSAVGPRVSMVKFPRSCGTTLCQVAENGASKNDGGPAHEAIFMTSVDAFVHAEGLEHIDVLKIDTEGHDPAVIFGAKSLLQAKRVTIMYFEYHNMGLWKTVTLQELVDALNSMGYDCYFEGTPTLTRLTGCWVNDYEFKQWSNVVCVNRDHAIAPEFEKLTWAGQGALTKDL